MDAEQYLRQQIAARQRRTSISGLRTIAQPSDCYVYRLNADGTKGELLRIEPPYEPSKKVRQMINVRTDVL